MSESRYDIRVELAYTHAGKQFWCAYDDQRYDYDFDGEQYVSNYSVISNSKWDAVKELIELLEEREGE